MSPAIWVDTEAALAKMCQELQASAIFGIDTESNSLYVYKEQVCLIQISTSDQDYLIDPLSIKDLSLLGSILASPEIEKVFHAAEYDVICLKRDFNFEIHNIFDTMLAARILGRKNNGLGPILEEEYGIIADKRFQRANWGKRPISQEMLYYAQMDSHFLIELRNKFIALLKETNRFGLAEEDFVRLTKIEPPKTPSFETDAMKLSNGQSYQNKQLSVLMALCKYRDGLAQERNVPLFKIFPNQFIQILVENMPANRDEIYSMGYSPMNQIEHYIQPILRLIAEARQNKDNHHAQYAQKPDWEFFKRMDALRAWRKQKAVELMVMSDIILPKDVLMDITHDNPSTLTQLAEIMKENPWRYKAYGEEILTVIHE